MNKQGDEIIVNASKNPTESHLYRFSLTEPFAEPEAITKEPGQHSTVFTRDLGLYVITSRTLKEMPTSRVFRKDGKLVGELPSVAENPAHAPAVELVKVGSKERMFHAAVVLPRSYDAQEISRDRRCLRRPASYSRGGGTESLAARSMVCRPGLHRRRDRMGAARPARGGLGTGYLPEIRLRPARRPGRRPQGARRKVSCHGPQSRRHRRLVVRRLHVRARRHAPARRLPCRRRRRSRCAIGTITTRTTRNATWASLQRTPAPTRKEAS